MPHSPALPYTLDQAVTEEQDFWRHIRALIREEIQFATKDAVDAMKIVARSQKMVIERLNDFTAGQQGISADVDRLAGWCTVKAMKDDELAAKIDKLLEAITPPMPPKTPP